MEPSWKGPDPPQPFQPIRAVVLRSISAVDADLIMALLQIEIVSNSGVGVDKIDLNVCKQKGIRVTNTPDVLTDEVANLAIGLILTLLRGLCDCDGYVGNGRWKHDYYKLITKFSGKTVGIIGLGRIGMAIAKRAEAFNCPICYYSRSEKPESQYKYYPSIVELASNCHILGVSCSLTRETHHIINREVIEALGSKGVLINIGVHNCGNSYYHVRSCGCKFGGSLFRQTIVDSRGVTLIRVLASSTQ